MASASVKVVGLDALQRFFIGLVPKVRRDIKAKTEGTGRLIEAEAKRRAPVRYGKLRQSISFEPIKAGFGASVSVGVPYGLFLEFGTGGLVETPEGFEELAGSVKGKGIRKVNIAPQPYLIPAFLKYRDVYYAEIEKALDRILK